MERCLAEDSEVILLTAPELIFLLQKWTALIPIMIESPASIFLTYTHSDPDMPLTPTSVLLLLL